MTRKEKEALLWKRKHKDYKTINAQGVKMVLLNRPDSTVLSPISALTDEELDRDIKNYLPKAPQPRGRVKNPVDLSDLAQFTGGGDQYKHWLPGIRYTEGIKYVADQAGAYWLIDLVASYNNRMLQKTRPFQIWTFEKTPQDKRYAAVVTAKEDTNRDPFVKQKIEYTDFPLDKFEFYSIGGVILLKSEY